jgi:hypothetical protein
VHFIGRFVSHERPFLLAGAGVMAKCEQGYLCDVCGGDVGEITDSDLYLRYVIGWVHPETLHVSPERHLRCNPILAQFIVDPRFEPVAVEGPMDKRRLDPNFVQQREQLVSRGYRRLHELRNDRPALLEYPLAEVIEAWKAQTK